MDGWFGPYRLIQELEPARMAPADAPRPMLVRRWAAVHERDHSGHLVYSIGPTRDRFAKRRFLNAAERLTGLRQAHVLSAASYALSDKLGACLVAPYPGHHAGVVTLTELLDHKGGQMSGAEAMRAVGHLLEGLAGTHRAGIVDGALGPDRVHVDPRGSLLIELPGLWWGLSRRVEPGPEDFRADLRAVVALAHRLVTGVSPLRGVTSLSRDADPRWRAWLSRGLDSLEGFASADEALAALPRSAPALVEPKPGFVRALLDRIRGSLPLL